MVASKASMPISPVPTKASKPVAPKALSSRCSPAALLALKMREGVKRNVIGGVGIVVVVVVVVISFPSKFMFGK